METWIKLATFDFPTVINAPINEPPLPRRKKCPELAYRHHEFIVDSSNDYTDSNVTRARVSVETNAASESAFGLFGVDFDFVWSFDWTSSTIPIPFRLNDFIMCQRDASR